jgi:hypothetical protein
LRRITSKDEQFTTGAPPAAIARNLLLLATADRPPGATSGSRIRARPLPSSRHPAPMTQAAITSDIHQSLDIHGDLSSQVALYTHLFIDDFANPVDFVIRQIANPGVRIDIRPLKQLLAGMKPNAVDIRQGCLYPLVAREIHSRNSRHVVFPSSPARPRAISPAAAYVVG